MVIPLQRSQAVTSSHTSQPHITAPVLEYRCMFTHDVHKKQKKWHDGILRFHAFNKRVMVYDDARNFVGDLHYRLVEEFGEGLELRLERPVLVQVEEQLGQSDTDLTLLLNRQRQDDTAATAISLPSRATLSRINAANPHIKPKSIRELLGASQGRIGRARIPIQSPYEQRVALNEIQPTEPPAKRRKVQCDYESTIVSTTEAAWDKQPNRGVDDVVELSSDDVDDQYPVKKLKQHTGAKNGQVPSAAPLHKNPVLDDTMTDSRPKGKTTKPKLRPKKPRSTTKPSEQSQPPINFDASKSDTSSRRGPDDTEKAVRARAKRPRSSLKFSSQIPRPKLMYRALLASTSSGETTSRVTVRADTDQPIANSTRTDNFTQMDQPEMSETPVNNSFLASPIVGAIDDDMHVQPVLPLPSVDRDNRHHSQAELRVQMENVPLQATRPPSSMKDNFETIMVTDSPLFMPRTDSQTSPLPVTQFTLEDLVIPHQSQVNEQLELPLQRYDAELEKLQSQQSQQGDAIDGTTRVSQDLSRVADTRNPAPAELVEKDHLESTPRSALKRLSPMTKSLTPEVPVSTSRPFRRIVSETLPNTDIDTNAIFDDFNEDDSNGEASPFLKQINDKTFENDQIGKPNRSVSLRQTTSDSAVLEAMIAAQNVAESDSSSRSVAPKQNRVDVADQVPDTRTVLEQNQQSDVTEEVAPKDTETGAWTSTEAFLLFDWWPPGREKPDYGQQDSVDAAAMWTGQGVGVDTVRSRLVQNAGGAVTNKKYGTFGSAKLVSQRS